MFKIIADLFRAIFTNKSPNVTHDFSNGQMNLVAYSNYGDKLEKTIYNASERDIEETINSLDWSNFNIVVLERAEWEYLTVSGLLEDDGTTPPGLASTWDEQKELYVTKEAPETLQDLIELMTRYLNRDASLKSLYE